MQKLLGLQLTYSNGYTALGLTSVTQQHEPRGSFGSLKAISSHMIPDESACVFLMT